MGEKIMTLHPQGKEGVNIDRDKYEAVRGAIVGLIGEHGEVAFQDLMDMVSQRLLDFDGAPGWYTTTVKLDLEARGVIERVPGIVPQRLRMAR